MHDVRLEGFHPVHAQGFRLGVDPVPRHRDGALDEIAARIGRVPEDDHVPAREVAIRQDARPRTAVRSVRELVHEHVVAREDRVLHRGARHVEDLEDEALERERERGGHENGLDRLHEAPFGSHHSTFKTARKASWGSSTRPTFFMRRLPSFCFSRSFFLRVMSPPSHFARTFLRSAFTVERARIFDPIAAWTTTSNICRGIISFIFSTSARPFACALSRCTMNASASTGSPLMRMSSFTR